MAPIETFHRHQKALYWQANGVDRFGNNKVDAKVELDVRWERESGDFIDPLGAVVAFDIRVVVNQAILEGSIMWEGGLDDLTALVGTADAPTGDFFRVIKYTFIPDIKNRHIRRLAYLMRHSDELPTLA